MIPGATAPEQKDYADRNQAAPLVTGLFPYRGESGCAARLDEDEQARMTANKAAVCPGR